MALSLSMLNTSPCLIEESEERHEDMKTVFSLRKAVRLNDERGLMKHFNTKEVGIHASD